MYVFNLSLYHIYPDSLSVDCFDLTFRNGGVHHGQTSEVLLHGDEHSSAGGTSSHRDDNQHRPGGVAAQGKRERQTG